VIGDDEFTHMNIRIFRTSCTSFSY